MLRAIALSLIVFISAAVLLPFTDYSTQDAHARSSWSRRRGYRRHSRAWWRRYRARMRNKRSASAHVRNSSSSSSRTLGYARRRSSSAGNMSNASSIGSSSSNARATLLPSLISTAGGTYSDSNGLWSLTVPEGWSSRPVASGGGMTFRFFAPGNRVVGQATLSVVASANPNISNLLSLRAQRRMIGGVSFTDLYRTVINKMIGAGGWVNNDLVREIGGQRTYVVLAQTPASNDRQTPPQAWMFYFVEMNGRIYSLAANAPEEFAERMGKDSAEIMASFRSRNVSTLATNTTQNR